MKKFNGKKALLTLSSIAGMASATMYQAFATSEGALDEVVAPIVQLLKDIMGPVLTIVGAVGALYCILLGVKYAKAEEPQEREKAKSHLKNAIIGFVLIFVLMLLLDLLMPEMIKWVKANETKVVSSGVAAFFG